MDPRQFDWLTRCLSVFASRRRFAGIVAAAGLAVALPGGAAAKKKRKKRCKKGAARCGKTCVNTKTNAAHCGGCGRACDSAETCRDGQCQPKSSTCGSGGTCLVFATSTIYPGNLGGLAGADQKCNARAAAANLPGTYMAWLSDNTGSPASRFVQSTGPYVLTTGARIADNWADLTNVDPEPRLDHPIDRDEFGGEITVNALYRYTWTNTRPDGTLADADRHCQNWATSQGTPNFGSAGNVNATGSFWTYATSIFCDNPGQRLYCFQQS